MKAKEGQEWYGVDDRKVRDGGVEVWSGWGRGIMGWRGGGNHGGDGTISRSVSTISELGTSREEEHQHKTTITTTITTITIIHRYHE